MAGKQKERDSEKKQLRKGTGRGERKGERGKAWQEKEELDLIGRRIWPCI